ncbi:Crp/Fnr family transcriptional regulator [Chitinophaga nivalis]|uniref:Cyclic nucleotide-binding domain-containing protein n=1 Tax=Chitinophaga nivalis TaxID=2991709 RepID=A0ABT3IGQ3_9BACT|nr:hypothetical protein [Chitinophaga nivalis]MCW3467344.1 hypothetical protein [Chitinophaga nivalis]MCW3482964.1 hypothetical protein [Chitinophaga nivalis]
MSILTGRPSPLQTMTLEASSLLRIPREQYLGLLKTTHGPALMRVAAELSFLSKQQQQIDLLTLTAAQRYAFLLQHQPAVVRRIPQKHLASYLGITPQSFSRIRKKKL